jgi:hypothetical protein
MLNIRVGAEAGGIALQYGSCPTKMVRLRLRNTFYYKTAIHKKERAVSKILYITYVTPRNN